MARSTKTKHVMDLVGTEPKKKPKPLPAEKVEKTPLVPKIVEAVMSEPRFIEAVMPEPKTVEAVIPETPVQQEETQEESLQEEAVQEEAPAPEPEKKEPVHKPMITAIVCELINQELGSVAERFHLSLTDKNLWELTRAALEEVRPEFSADSEDREKKLEKLRPKVIAAMTKAAIKAAAKDRNN